MNLGEADRPAQVTQQTKAAKMIPEVQAHVSTFYYTMLILTTVFGPP